MAELDKFENFLHPKPFVPDKQLPYYLHWVERFLPFCEKTTSVPGNDAQVTPFLQLLGKTKEAHGGGAGLAIMPIYYELAAGALSMIEVMGLPQSKPVLSMAPPWPGLRLRLLPPTTATL